MKHLYINTKFNFIEAFHDIVISVNLLSRNEMLMSVFCLHDGILERKSLSVMYVESSVALK